MELFWANLEEEAHERACVKLLNDYILDPMGGGDPLEKEQALKLIEGLRKTPNVEILLASMEGEFVGLCTLFVNFSTFKQKPYFNLHDVIVSPEARGKGVGRSMLEHLIKEAKRRDYAKVTLEVREDNQGAQTLYQSLGFRESEPRMFFWSRML
ncbi:GNAT family N-acetyltransferase [Wolinella succinogenes]|uniref:GNAT family N-acetyltransferase n=1 Tax=Wolinella succinogenes TaxID=844 RepID=UPI00240A23B6|nr:GNAT family N-acetyltransferase [Wolinella succinogenes]